jgi:hypothetical protein
MGKWVKPSASVGGNGRPSGNWTDRNFAERYPALAGWLGESLDEQGLQRATGTLLVFAEGGQIKCCLKDRETNAVAFLTAGTWAQLLDGAEEALSSGDADWRAARDKPPSRR